MSTRCQVIIKDKYGEVWFYRHSDGYPEGTMPSLEKFLSWVKECKIRDNPEQAAGWLVMIGAEEYKTDYLLVNGEFREVEKTTLLEPTTDWKVGAYEPCAPKEHGDIEYLYTVDLDSKTIRVEER